MTVFYTVAIFSILVAMMILNHNIKNGGGNTVFQLPPVFGGNSAALAKDRDDHDDLYD